MRPSAAKTGKRCGLDASQEPAKDLDSFPMAGADARDRGERELRVSDAERPDFEFAPRVSADGPRATQRTAV